MNWVDAVIIVLIILFAAIGFWKGFVFSLLSVFSGFINFCISIFLARPVTNLLNKIFGLEGALTKAFGAKFTSATPLFDVNMVGMSQADINAHITNTLSEGNMPFKRIFTSMLKVTPEKIADKDFCSVGEILSKSLGSFFSLIIGFVIIFLLIYLVLWIVSLMTKKARQVDGIRVTDRILGVLFGLVKGFLVIAFIFSILSFFNEGGVLKPFFDYINNSALGSFIYGHVNAIIDKYLNFSAVVKAVQDVHTFI